MSEPRNYIHGHSPAVETAYAWRTVDNSAAFLRPRLHSGDRILDVGCGFGSITEGLADLVPQGSVLGIDASSAAIEKASERTRPNLEFRVDRLESLVADQGGSFDVVFAHQVVQHFRDPVAALRQMADLAKPGGLVAVRDSDYAGFFHFPASPSIQRWHELYQAAAQNNGTEPQTGRRMLEFAHAAGLEDCEVSSSSWTFADPAGRKHWAGTMAERVSSGHFHEQLVQQNFATGEELAEIAAGWRSWADQPTAIFVVPSVELLARV